MGHPYYLGYIFDLNFEFIVHKFKFIIPYFLYYVINNVLFISGIIVLFALNFQKKTDDYVKLLNLYFIFSLIFIFSAYLFRDMEVEYSVRTTMKRIIFAFSGFYALMVINFIKNLKKIF